ncbi:hypothetical protein ACQKLP_18275 [Chitinophaga sp. NPDC101104]|uniref:hypothetical protein n=1 Tax=Chitinophaga sp. NPDC101104 TaxID=3390561 RepID=UPI003D007165
MHRTLIFPILLLLITGCQQQGAPGGETGATRIDSAMRTAFVPVPNHPGEPGDNIIYAASFALAWDSLCGFMGGDQESTLPLIRRLNASRKEEKPLLPGDYQATVEVIGDEIKVTAAFQRNLPFAVPFDIVEGGMVFGKKSRVKAFGMPVFNHAQAGQVGVLYYESDDKFVIRLTPGPERDEMVLAKGFSEGEKLSNMRSRVEAAIVKGQQEKAKGKHPWKYFIGEEDEVKIPVVRFHLSTVFPELIDQLVAARGQMLQIKVAEQRTAFELDEKGVIIESEAVIADSAATVIDDVLPVKHLYFDEPFLVMVSRKGAENPYFIMKVANAELMREVKGETAK